MAKVGAPGACWFALALVSSILLHAGLVLSLPHPTLREPDESFEVSLTLVTTASPPTDPLPTTVAPVPNAAQESRFVRTRHKVVGPEMPAAAGSTEAPAPTLPVAPRRVERPAIDLDPRAVAAAYLRATGPTLDEGVRPTAAGGASGSPGDPSVPSVLHAEADGSYSYAGTGFSAKVKADGGLTMENHSAHMGAGGLVFDLTGAAELAAGNDPYRSERREFLEATREFREKLLARAEADALRRRLLSLRRRPGLSIEQRKVRTFELWDDMAEDEQGQTGRRVLEAFVRDHYAEPDDAVFSAGELEALNARRTSRQPFAPY